MSMTQPLKTTAAAGSPLDGRVKRWDRLLWGVEFRGGHAADPPMLIGNLWARDVGGGDPYPGEPTRALLFCTRLQARHWCAETMRKWRDGRQRDDSVARWIVRPVRVRETVRIEAPSAEVTGLGRNRSNDD